MKVEELNAMFEEPGAVPIFEEEVPEELDKDTDEGVTEEEEDDDDTGEEEQVDALPVYSILRDYNIIPELENPTEEQIREHLDNLASSRIADFMSTKPSRFQELTAYALAKEGATDDDLDEFYSKYLKKGTGEITDNDAARQYLQSRKEFVELYDDAEDLKEALDLLEDKDKLISKAKALQSKESSQSVAEKEAVIKAAQDEAKAKLESSKVFASKVQEELKTLSWKEEQKTKAIKAASQDNINKVWSELVKNPKGFIQFANLLTYFNDGNFDSLYNVLEGKKTSNNVTSKEKAIAKDTIGSLLGKSKQITPKGDLSDMFSPA
jgi:hypothetical protein